jgi:hypothetical protein
VFLGWIFTGEGKKGVSEMQKYSPPLDKGIEKAVHILADNNIETFESCEGGPGHSYPEPTVRFYGDKSEGFKALAIALQNGLKVNSLRRAWPIIDGEPTGPWWEITFDSHQGRGG